MYRHRKALVISFSDWWDWENKCHHFWDSQAGNSSSSLGKVMSAYLMLTQMQTSNTVQSSSFINTPHCKVNNYPSFSEEWAATWTRRWFSKLIWFILHLQFENWISNAQRSLLFPLAKLRITYIIKPVSHTGILGTEKPNSDHCDLRKIGGKNENKYSWGSQNDSPN